MLNFSRITSIWGIAGFIAKIRARFIDELQWMVLPITKRKHDIAIGGEDDPYILRWYVIPKNRFFNIYLHRFMRSDELIKHDHPWWSLSIMLEGACWEHIWDEKYEFEYGETRVAGEIVFRRAKLLHRIELIPNTPCWTLFITGPAFREWGFFYPDGKWVHHSLHTPGRFG